MPTSRTKAFPAAALSGARLLRIHRHLLACLDHVVGLRPLPSGRGMLRLKGGQELEVSRSAYPRLKAHLGLPGG
jgi:DNA-binding LytR/AlgR family response regulator